MVYSTSRSRLAIVCTPPHSVCPPPFSVCSPFWLSQVFQVGFVAVKSRVGLLNEYIKTSYCVHLPKPKGSAPPMCLFVLLTISGVSNRILMLLKTKFVNLKSRLRLAAMYPPAPHCLLPLMTISGIFQLDLDTVINIVGLLKEKIRYCS